MLIVERVVREREGVRKEEEVVFAVGRLTKTPEGVKESESGRKYLKGISIAVDTYQNKEKKTVFYPLVFFDRDADVMAQYGEKGRLVAIFGKKREEEFVANDGEVKRYIYVIVERFQFCGTGRTDKKQKEERTDVFSLDIEDDRLPF